jgi:hypothetical protein
MQGSHILLLLLLVMLLLLLLVMLPQLLGAEHEMKAVRLCLHNTWPR